MSPICNIAPRVRCGKRLEKHSLENVWVMSQWLCPVLPIQSVVTGHGGNRRNTVNSSITGEKANICGHHISFTVWKLNLQLSVSFFFFGTGLRESKQSNTHIQFDSGTGRHVISVYLLLSVLKQRRVVITVYMANYNLIIVIIVL